MDQILSNPARQASVTVAVVDQRPGDYADLIGRVQGADVCWQFVANAAEALRLARTRPVDLWMVNDSLPDMPGMDVCALLKNFLAEPVICMVTDKYDQAVEREARIRGATLFGCKPISPELISQMANRNRKSINGRRTSSLFAQARPPNNNPIHGRLGSVAAIYPFPQTKEAAK
jgi:DNA-binding response OmpR family regulator